MADTDVAVVTDEGKLEMLIKRYDEMKSENEARWKQMQDKMNEMELKVNNMDQLTKDLDGIKANLRVQTERLNDCERLRKEGHRDMKMAPMLEEMRDEFEKMKVEQTRLALKANDDSAAIYTIKAKADVFIELLEQKDEKLEKKLNEHKTNINATMDDYKNQLEDVKTKIASMDTDKEKEPRALDQMENKILEMIKDLEKQYEWVTIMKQFRKDEKYREVKQTKMNGTGLAEKKETMESQKQKDGDDLRLNMDNQIATINKQLETLDNRVTESENKWTAADSKATTIVNEVAKIDNKVTSDDEKKADAIDNRVTDVNQEVVAMNKRLTWMEDWQKKLQDVGLFGTLSQRDGCLVSEFTFTVKNVAEEITKAKDDEYHCIESEPFYTNIKGYRVKIMVYPNESDMKYVGVFLRLVKGEFDDSVSWPFICKYEFSSVGRDGTQFASFSVDPTVTKRKSLFWRPQNKSNIGYGAIEYIKIRKLLVNKDKYLIDGGLKIKTTIWLDN